MTVKTLSEFLCCHPSTIYRLIKHHSIPAFQLGADWRFHKPDIERWVRERTLNCSDPAQGWSIISVRGRGLPWAGRSNSPEVGRCAPRPIRGPESSSGRLSRSGTGHEL